MRTSPLSAIWVAIVLLATACGPSSLGSASPGSLPSGGVATDLGLPFGPATRIAISSLGLHADNFNSVDGGGLGVATFEGGDTVNASLDYVVTPGTEVHPVAIGRVRGAWTDCDVVVIDHLGGLWTVYIHVMVMVHPGDFVTPQTVLGTVQGLPGAGSTPLPCGLQYDEPHLHLAIAAASSGSAATYVELAGRTLCGHQVAANGDLVGLGTVGGPEFIVPDCGAR